jgi:uncharacterized protein
MATGGVARPVPMKCPVDQRELVMSERQGIEIDYCPQCRGVWLDRGELDKIIERSAAQPAAPQPYAGSPKRHDDDDHRRRKRGFLGELFD